MGRRWKEDRAFWCRILGVDYAKCEDGIAGHVFKSMDGENKGAGDKGEDIAVHCGCGHTINVRRCVRCGFPETHDRGVDEAHRAEETP